MYRLMCRALGVFLLLSLSLVAFAQTAQFSGRVTDPSQALVQGADIRVVNQATGVERRVKTNVDGLYTVPFVAPGTYQVFVQANGFSTAASHPLIVTVGQALVFDVQLKVGVGSQEITVDGGSQLLNTTDATVGTVIDRQFVDNIPLNGRSFQDLISMTPGVVTASPQGAQGSSAVGFSGDFSVNGQRTQSNYYTVDGVSGNIGAGNGYATVQAGSGGGLPAGTAFGTTQSLVSVDALQEFRVSSSTYSAEYGHGPGGQFSLITRSGTDNLHGTAFDYLRNNYFDANDWFNDHYGKPMPALRQNDFGGTIGGPIWIPHLYDGRRHTFFFFSYEGLRITQPQAAVIQYVPDTYMRQNVSPTIQQILNAYPAQNGVDYGTPSSPSLAQFIEPYTLPGSIDSTSIRFDHTFSPKLIVFFRFANTTSSSASRSLSALTTAGFETRTYTAGITNQLSPALANELRAGFAHSESNNIGIIDNFGGAQAINLQTAMGGSAYPNGHPQFTLNFAGVGTATLSDQNAQNLQSQWNITDNVSLSIGRHHMKAGIDYRWIRSPQNPSTPQEVATYSSSSQVTNNSAGTGLVVSRADVTPIFNQFAAYVQDEWHISSSVSVSMGLRWEINPALSEEHGRTPYTLLGSISNPSSLRLAPPGTRLWNTAKFNFAPRLGVAWVAHASPNWQTVIRTGGGVFFDTANEVATQGYNGIGYLATTSYSAAALPYTTSQLSITPSLTPPYAVSAYAFPSHMQMPYTLQWNASLQQAMGKAQAFTLSYVGANGRRLIGEQQLSVKALNPNFSTIIYLKTGVTSSYESLQLQFQRTLTRGIQFLTSYTWAHSMDFGSNATALPLARGNSDFDVRNNFQAGVSWNLPRTKSGTFADVILNNWGVDSRNLMRSAFPITLAGTLQTDPTTGNQYYSGVNYDPSKPLYLYGSQYPGGRAINGGPEVPTSTAAIRLPTGTNVSGNAPRNFVRGVGLAQTNLAVRRQFPLYGETSLQFRAEAFNVFNRPNFGYVDPTLTDATFGQVTTMLNGSLATMSPQYQQGGSRSMQFALKLLF